MIAIITINYNLSKETCTCVNSILASTYQDIVVYLIDNGSEREDYENLVNSFGHNSRVQVLRLNKNCGYVGGVNYGLKNAVQDNPDYLLVMNNDTIIDKEAVGHLVDTANRFDSRAIVSGKVYYYDHPDILQHTGVIFKDKRYLKTYYPGKGEKDIGQCDEEAERDSLDDVFWLLPAGIVKDVGYYCDYFFLYAEQGDYALRARKKGYKLIYAPKAKLWHKESMTSGGGNARSLSICYWRGQGMFIFQYRNLKKRYFYPYMIINFTKYVFRSLVNGKDEIKQSRATLRGYFYGFRWMFHKKPNDGYNPYTGKR